MCAKYDALAAELSETGENPEDELEKRRETEKAMVSESQILLTEITEYVTTCHEMPSYVGIFTALDGDELLTQASSTIDIDDQPKDDIIEKKMKMIQAAVEVMEEEYAAIFTQVVVKKKNKNTATVSSAVQYAFF